MGLFLPSRSALLLLFLYTFYLVCAALVNAADIVGSDKMMALFLEECPTNWGPMASNTEYGGRILKGSNGGQTYRGNKVTGNSPFTHSHSSWAFYTSWGNTVKGECQCWWCHNCGAKGIDDGARTYITQSNSNMAASHANVAYVTMNLCRYNGAAALQIPGGLITYFDRSDCPATKSSFYGTGNGRTLTFAASGVGVGTNSVAVVGNGGDIGYHTHNMAQSAFNPRRREAAVSGATGETFAGFTQTHYWWHYSPTSNNHLNIAYYQTAVCQINNVPGQSSVLLPDIDAIFFSLGNSGGPNGCPPLFRQPYGRRSRAGYDYNVIVGRIPKIRHTGTIGVTYGGSQARHALGTGAPSIGFDDHSHTITTGNIEFPAQHLAGAWDTCCNNNFMQYWSYRFTVYTTGIATGATVPFAWLRACTAQNPTSSPTRSPTKAPTTSRPTQAPSTSFPTMAPSDAPATSSPTGAPTHFPSRSPTTSRPTLAPTTGAPSLRPTTSMPTVSPSHDPTTSPTPAPVWVNVCSEGDEILFQNYDNYVIQAASCSDECAIDILTNAQLGRKCVDLCVSIELYTPLCRYCIADFALCQENECRSRCVANRFSAGCVECTNKNCREAFNICTGMEGSELDSGGGDGGGKAPPPRGRGKKTNYALIAGSALGGMIGLAAAVFVVRKYQIKRGLTAEVQEEMEERIFVKKTVVEGGEGEEMTTNPMYGHPSMQFAASTGSVIAASAAINLSSANPNITDVSVAGKMLRTRFSFHGTDADEIDVGAGEAVTAIERNADWYLVKHDMTRRIGLIPATYVIDT